MIDHQESDRIIREYKRRESQIPKDFYDLRYPSNYFSYSQRIKNVLHLFRRESAFPINEKKILEIGCGRGDWLLDFTRLGAEPQNLCGIELDETRLAVAKKRLPSADLRLGNAAELPWPDQSMDIVLQSTVFTSILDNDFKMRVAREMLRVMKKDGFILWYDFFWDNPKNPNVKGVRKFEILKLFPDCSVDLKAITLAPPITRFLANFSWILCFSLENLRFLNTHYLGVIRKIQ